MTKKNYDPIKKHLNHPSEMRSGTNTHKASLHCLRCNKHIKWMTALEIAAYHLIEDERQLRYTSTA